MSDEIQQLPRYLMTVVEAPQKNNLTSFMAPIPGVQLHSTTSLPKSPILSEKQMIVATWEVVDNEVVDSWLRLQTAQPPTALVPGS